MKIDLVYYPPISMTCHHMNGRTIKFSHPAGWKLELHSGLFYGTIEFSKKPSKNVLRKAKRQLIKECKEDLESGFFFVN